MTRLCIVHTVLRQDYESGPQNSSGSSDTSAEADSQEPSLLVGEFELALKELKINHKEQIEYWQDRSTGVWCVVQHFKQLKHGLKLNQTVSDRLEARNVDLKKIGKDK